MSRSDQDTGTSAAVFSSLEYPRVVSWLTHAQVQAVFATLALGAILFFVAQFYLRCPYDGMWRNFYDFESDLMIIDTVLAGGPAEKAGILADDRILAVNGRRPEPWTGRPVYGSGVGRGEVVTYEVLRGDETLTLYLTLGSYRDNLSLLGQVVGMQFLSFLFWVLGLVLCLFVPPHAIGARLVGLGWLIAGICLAATSVPNGWLNLDVYAAIVITALFAAAVLVAAHLYFPAPSLMAHHKPIVYALAIVTFFLSAASVFGRGNLRMYWAVYHARLITNICQILFETLSILMCIGLLAHNRFQAKDADIRRQTGIVLWGMVLGGGPFVAVKFLEPVWKHAGTLYHYTYPFFVLVPLAYAYVIHQRKLVRVDFIINRIVVFFVLTLLVFGVSILILGIIAWVFDFPIEFPLLGGALAALLSLPSPALQRAVQQRVNRILYGCHYDFSSVTSGLSGRLARAIDRETLTDLLTQDLGRQMGIQRAVLFLSDGNVLELQPPGSKEPLSIPVGDELCQVLVERKKPARTPRLWGALSPATQARWRGFAWAQLFAPMMFEDRLQGLLILGSRASGDVYSNQDVDLIATVARQGALAYENVQLVETLRGLHRRLVRAGEAQRKQVARDLHDTVLQQLFFIKQGLLREHKHTIHIELIDQSIQTLRRTIGDQRPPLLDQGLPLSLESLVEETQEMAGEELTVSWRGNVTGRLGLSDEQATALYRIAQEALNNALKHAEATQVTVSLEIESDGFCIRLGVHDDGVGMPTPERDGSTSERCYGLIGMQERANMIGAELHIISAPGDGTSVSVEVML